MDWRLFLSTFTLIFFAELGDKTQLAAMASAAGGRSTWSVFAGASAALVFSTLIAVLVGGALQKLVPVPVIKTFAGILFLLFGGLLLWSAMRVEAATEPAPAMGVPVAAAEGAGGGGFSPPTPVKVGFLSRVVLDAAARFERAAADDYDALAGRVRGAELQSLFAALAQEERRHLARVEDLTRAHFAAPAGAAATEQRAGAAATEKPAGESEEFPRFLWAGGEMLDEEMEILAAAIRQENAMAGFYTALADSCLLPGPKAAFQALAQEELDHMRRLQNAGC